MRKFAANIAFTGTKYIYNPLIITSDDGEILSVTEQSLESEEPAGLEYHSGMIIPGLINAHTHIELSVLNQTYQAKKGILDFVKHVISLRRTDAMPDKQSIARIIHKMRFQGIKAFADIANSAVSFSAKVADDTIVSKTFFEFFPLSQEQAIHQTKIFASCKSKFPQAEIYPAFHSPYAIAKSGLSTISKNFEQTEYSSLHFRESEFETSLKSDNNPLIRFYRDMNPDFSPAFVNPGFSNEQGEILKNLKQFLLVHNIHITENEIENLLIWSEQQQVKLNFVICPRSNENITGKLPPVDLLMKYQLNLCLGTDSLLSAPNLSIFDEMKFLQQKLPALKFREILKMATLNAANALGWSEDFGEIAVGKRPGLNLIEMKQLKRDVLHPDAQLKVLI